VIDALALELRVFNENFKFVIRWKPGILEIIDFRAAG